MSLERAIDQITERALARVSVCVGNGASIHPEAGGRGVLSMPLAEVEDEGTVSYPRHGRPTLRGARFLLNLIPVRGVEVDFYASVPLSNVKVYVRMLMTPVSYNAGGGFFGTAYANVDSFDVLTVPHGTIPTRVNAVVDSSSGAVTQGQYFFYYGKLFSDGTVLIGLGSGDGQEDNDYPYVFTNSIGWLLGGGHYPPIDMI